MSSSGVLFLRLVPTGSGVRGGSSGGSFLLALRQVAGPYTAGLGIGGTGRRKTLFPRQDVLPIDPKTGQFTDAWYRFLQFQYEGKIGGDNGPSLLQVASGVTTAQSVATAAAGQLVNVTQALETNAAVSAASNEVLQNAATPGAAQIPPPVLTVPPYVAPGSNG